MSTFASALSKMSNLRLPTFQQEGRCAETDPELFFPEKGDPSHLAKLVCFRCEIQAECLDWALENDERFGVWGGTSPGEREKLTRKMAPEFLRAQRARDDRRTSLPAY